MYIRTSCGVLGILKHIKLNMYEFNNEQYIKNGIRLHNSNHDYTIKLQGEELIDVLKVNKDWVSYGGTNFVKLTKDIRQNTIIENITDVITKEQFIKLAQQVS